MVLKKAVPLIPTFGFTRATLAQAALELPNQEALPERAIDTLFGQGDEARKTLIRAWLQEGKLAMGPHSTRPTVEDALKTRLDWNVPVLDKLPDVCCQSLMTLF